MYTQDPITGKVPAPYTGAPLTVKTVELLEQVDKDLHTLKLDIEEILKTPNLSPQDRKNAEEYAKFVQTLIDLRD